MKKDFVPYSERRASEAKLEAERASQQPGPSMAPGLSEDGYVPTVKELVDLLPI
jgi:hypothetical protein